VDTADRVAAVVVAEDRRKLSRWEIVSHFVLERFFDLDSTLDRDTAVDSFRMLSEKVKRIHIQLEFDLETTLD
jgi:hypothetical protein